MRKLLRRRLHRLHLVGLAVAHRDLVRHWWLLLLRRWLCRWVRLRGVRLLHYRMRVLTQVASMGPAGLVSGKAWMRWRVSQRLPVSHLGILLLLLSLLHAHI